MILISEAVEIIKCESFSLGSEHVDLGNSVGRVLVEDVVADTDLPPFDRSQMDGFAVRADDTKNAPVGLKIIGESAAGKGFDSTVKLGEAVRIMTGARVPKGADSVQKVELTKELPGIAGSRGTRGTNGILDTPGPGTRDNGLYGIVEIREAAEKDKFIVAKGFEVKQGETVFAKGEIITPNMIASLAAFGCSEVKVFQQPAVAILPTGSEIVDVHEMPGKDQIRNSNSELLKALCKRSGAVANDFPIAKDDIAELKSQILKACESNDILIITGGVSVGKYDFTKAALGALGAEIFFERVQLKPGKPTVFARLGKTLIFGLPGNPVSAAVTFYLFVRKAILQIQNAAQTELRQGFAVMDAPVKAARERDTYLPAELVTDDGARVTAKPLKWRGSSDFIGFARAEALIVVPKGESFKKGEVARIAYL